MGKTSPELSILLILFATTIADALSKSITGDIAVLVDEILSLTPRDLVDAISFTSLTFEATTFVLSKSVFSFSTMCCSLAVNLENEVSVPLGLVPVVGCKNANVFVPGRSSV